MFFSALSTNKLQSKPKMHKELQTEKDIYDKLWAVVTRKGGF